MNPKDDKKREKTKEIPGEGKAEYFYFYFF